jgi:hypothetical protein
VVFMVVDVLTEGSAAPGRQPRAYRNGTYRLNGAAGRIAAHSLWAVREGARYRWRFAVRNAMPWWLWKLVGWPGGSRRDCGAHEWFNHDGIEDHCFHCQVGRRPHQAERG